MLDRITIHPITEEDVTGIVSAFRAQGWEKPEPQYIRYCSESRLGTRTVVLAKYAGEFAGYLTIMWQSEYPPFRQADIPEIVDFNVLIKYRRLGIGSALMDEAEQRIATRSPVAGIGVGLTADYGAAQVLYVKRGYIPDGRGAVWRGQAIVYDQQITVDDDLAVYLTKQV